MKFKNKIIISFCIIIFVPIFLATLVLFSMQHIQMRAIEQTYGVEGDGYSYFSNSVQLLSRFTREIYREVYKVADNQPEKLEDGAYLEKINQQLEEKASYLIVRKGQELVYIGKSAGTSLLTELPEYGSADGNADSGTYMDGEEQALVKQIDFVYPDGAKGSIFIVTRLEEMVPELKSLLIDIMVSIVLILVLTACMLTVWIYTSLINPIKKLQAAAQNIKEGNLDFTIEAESRDEIGELCTSFEEMRQRLKDNAEEKINSEKENKMLISNIAHDLKTPITAVKGYAEGLMDGVADTPEKRDKYIRTIYNKANEMDTLINELTLYAKIDTNRIPYNFAKINVGEYFNDCIEEIGLDLESKNIGLAYFNYTDGSTQIIADPEQLKRVVKEIISVETGNDFVTFEIKDVAPIAVAKKYAGIGVTLSGKIKNTRTPFSIDFGVGDVIVPKQEKRRIPTQLDDFKAPVINTYSIETTVAEKIDAILSLMEFSSRMKDYYDIYYLSHKFDFEGKVLCEALSKTFINREHNFTIEQFEQIMTFDSDDGMQKKWKAFKKKIDVKMEEFPFILQSINEFLCEPYTAVIKGTVFEKYWDANECSWN